jgi:hypothetical protein
MLDLFHGMGVGGVLVCGWSFRAISNPSERPSTNQPNFDTQQFMHVYVKS